MTTKKQRLTSTSSIIPLPRDRFRGLVTNTIWLVSCSALDGLIGARLRSTYPGLLRRGAQTPTYDQEIAEAGEPHLHNYIVARVSRLPTSNSPGIENKLNSHLKLHVFRDANEYERSNVLILFLSLPFAAAVRSG